MLTPFPALKRPLIVSQKALTCFQEECFSFHLCHRDNNKARTEKTATQEDRNTKREDGKGKAVMMSN